MQVQTPERAINTFTRDALRYRDRFYGELSSILRQLVIDRAEAAGRSEVTKDDMEECLREAVSKALDRYL